MVDRYKIKGERYIIYQFTTGTRSKESCLEWIKEQFDYLPHYKVYLNGVLISEKREQKVNHL